jgi:hypothetical protein
VYLHYKEDIFNLYNCNADREFELCQRVKVTGKVHMKIVLNTNDKYYRNDQNVNHIPMRHLGKDKIPDNNYYNPDKQYYDNNDKGNNMRTNTGYDKQYYDNNDKGNNMRTNTGYDNNRYNTVNNDNEYIQKNATNLKYNINLYDDLRPDPYAMGKIDNNPNMPNMANKHDMPNSPNKHDIKQEYYGISSNINNSIWYNSLTYNKNALFFMNDGQQIFYFSFNNGFWKQLNLNYHNYYFGAGIRAVELPDSSYFLTGGEFNKRPGRNATNFKEGIFKDKKNMLIGRKCHSIVHLKGNVYVFGGIGEYGYPIAESERFSLSQETWYSIDKMKLPKAYSASIVYDSNHIFLIGGYSAHPYDNVYHILNLEK